METPPTPFLGNFGDCILLKKSATNFVKDLYDQSKGLRYMGFYIFDKPFLLIRDPELIKHVLVKDFSVFCDRYATSDVNDRIGSATIFLLKNPAWRTLRTKITPVFTSGRLKKMFHLMTLVADDLNEYLDGQKLENGKVIEVRDLCANFTTDMVSSIGLGLQVNSLKDSNVPFRHFGRKMFERSIMRGLEFLSIFFMPHLTKYTRAEFFGKETTAFFQTVLLEVVNQRIQSGEKREDFVDLMIELKQNHDKEGDIDGYQFGNDELVAQAAGFFTGGFETSSNTMSFCLYELALNMDIQKTLRKEILQALDETSGKRTYDMVTSLPYLDMVVSETLRMYPPLGFLDRVAVTDYKIPNSDVIIEKGTPVSIPMIGLHLDPEYFPDPEKFDPLRFTEENKQKRPSCIYFPFGEGPHNCIGLRMGLLQTKLGLVQMLSKYEVTPCEKTLIPIVLDPKGFNAQPVTSLPYLDMVVSETLRIYPPLGFLDRVAVIDYKIPNSDVVIEKGTSVYIPMIGLHHEPEYFPQPKKFDPLRFTEENKQKRPSYTYFPFGEGPHNCIGFRLGLLQVKLGLVQMLSKYEVTPCEKTLIPIILDPKGFNSLPVGELHLNVRKIATEAA
ncbi:Cytochrome P450 6k1 [Dufourea novaeangliae]|uniref:Cytochrome P450 6k1 n=1 Tax=Dufourea novaeangliae TaxID=178035 RepID=A0A154PSD7_DUFNO|nr:Cytochrome P450 6k1 [Dufourea novaeangliae]